MPPWEALKAAESLLDEVRRRAEALPAGSPGRAAADLDVAAAAAEARGCRVACGALFAELMLYATRADGLRQFVGGLLDGLDLADDYARGLCEDVGRCVRDLAEDAESLRRENWELATAVARLELRLEQLEAADHEREAQRQGARADGAGPGGGAEPGRPAFRVVPAG